MPLGIIAALDLQPSQAMLRELYEQALLRQKTEHGDADPRTAQAARDLGLFLGRQGNASDAHEALAEAVRISEKALGPRHPQTLADVAELAGVSGRPQAEPLWLRAAGSPDARVAARALAALGQLRENVSDPAGAAKFYRQALAKEEAASGKESARIAVRLNALARVVDLSEGIALLERSLMINRSQLGAVHLETATIQANLAGLLLNAGRVDEAARQSSNALSTFEKVLDEDHQRTAGAAFLLAHALRGKGDMSGSEQMFRRALAIDERIYGPRHPQTLSDGRALAEFLRKIGKEGEAAELEKRLLSGAP